MINLAQRSKVVGVKKNSFTQCFLGVSLVSRNFASVINRVPDKRLQDKYSMIVRLLCYHVK